jgi:hypothetical protein
MVTALPARGDDAFGADTRLHCYGGGECPAGAGAEGLSAAFVWLEQSPCQHLNRSDRCRSPSRFDRVALARASGGGRSFSSGMPRILQSTGMMVACASPAEISMWVVVVIVEAVSSLSIAGLAPVTDQHRERRVGPNFSNVSASKFSLYPLYRGPKSTPKYPQRPANCPRGVFSLRQRC